MKISFGNMTKLNIFDISKQPLQNNEIGRVCLIEEIMEETVEACFAQFGEDLD